MKILLAFIAILLLAGCAALERAAAPAGAPSTAAVKSPARSSADELVAYLARLRGMNDAALAAEASRQRRDASDLGRVKAALAISLMLQSDEGDIIALVDPAAKKENGDRDVRAMASFLQVVAGERRRLKESAAAAVARLRDERRQHESQKQRAETLQQKLEALTDLEKSLSDRPSPNR